MRNSVTLRFSAKSTNESFARISAAAFVSYLDPTIETISDIKTSVSEAVTNSIIHGYEGKKGIICMSLSINNDVLTIRICDKGKGIKDIKEAMTPLFTSKPDLERSGMGFTVMENFMDTLDVKSAPGKGTSVTMTKRII